MADLDIRAARKVVERAIVKTLQLAYGTRGPAQADVAALRAFASAQVLQGSLFFVTSKGVCYQFDRFSSAVDDGDLAVKPNDVVANGRWLKTASSIQSGYAKRVRLYAGETTAEQLQTRIFGVKPAFLLRWTGSEHVPKGFPGGVYRYFVNFDLYAISTNFRPEDESQEGSPFGDPSDPGTIAMIGDAKVALAGTVLGVDGVSVTYIGDEEEVIADLAGRRFVEKLSLRVFATVNVPDQVLQFKDAAVTYQLAKTADGASEIDLNNCVRSGYTIQTGPGFTKFPAPGTAFISGQVVSSAPVAYTFLANSDTYRDLKPDGTFAYSAVGHGEQPPAQSAGTLRVGLTVTDATGVAADHLLAGALVDIVTDVVPSPGKTVTALVVNPAMASIAAAELVQYAALATYYDGTTEDVSDRAAWSLTDPSKATIDAEGTAVGIASGSTGVRATYGGVASNTATLTVT